MTNQMAARFKALTRWQKLLLGGFFASNNGETISPNAASPKPKVLNVFEMMVA